MRRRARGAGASARAGARTPWLGAALTTRRSRPVPGGGVGLQRPAGKLGAPCASPALPSTQRLLPLQARRTVVDPGVQAALGRQPGGGALALVPCKRVCCRQGFEEQRQQQAASHLQAVRGVVELGGRTRSARRQRASAPAPPGRPSRRGPCPARRTTQRGAARRACSQVTSVTHSATASGCAKGASGSGSGVPIQASPPYSARVARRAAALDSAGPLHPARVCGTSVATRPSCARALNLHGGAGGRAVRKGAPCACESGRLCASRLSLLAAHGAQPRAQPTGETGSRLQQWAPEHTRRPRAHHQHQRRRQQQPLGDPWRAHPGRVRSVTCEA